jgi:hypothetical protein
MHVVEGILVPLPPLPPSQMVSPFLWLWVLRCTKITPGAWPVDLCRILSMHYFNHLVEQWKVWLK